MSISRRDFVKASAAVGTALGLGGPALLTQQRAYAAEGGLPIIWLQGSACTGCSVSLLNSIHYATIDDLAVNTLDIEYHSNLSAAAGHKAVEAIQAARARGGYVLVIEGAIPTGANGRYCMVWEGMTMLGAVQQLAPNASAVLAVGTCAAFGGMAAGAPNPTACKPVSAIVTNKPIINIPGCPIHPDWLVGTVAYMLRYGKPPALDNLRRPVDFYGRSVHETCPNLMEYNSKYSRWSGHAQGQACFSCHEDDDDDIPSPRRLGGTGCSYAFGCRGIVTGCDCSVRKWNGGETGQPGVNWCVAAGAPCHGCTEPTFPDGMSPFYALNETGLASGIGGGAGGDGSGTVNCRTCHSSGPTSGTLPSGHPSIGGGSTGGTSGQVNCRSCHDDEGDRNGYGTLPRNHPSISGGGSTGRDDDDDDDDEDDDD